MTLHIDWLSEEHVERHEELREGVLLLLYSVVDIALQYGYNTHTH